MSGKLRNNHTLTLFPDLDGETLNEQYDAFARAFKSAASIDDLNKLVEDVDSATHELESNLHNYATVHSKKHQQEVSSVELNRTKLSFAIANSSSLNSLFSSANDLGHSLTFKIRSLDHEIGNVEKTLSFVKDVQLLKNNINQANYAIEHRNWTLAAQCINTITTKIDGKLVNGKYASVVIPSTNIPELPHVTVDQWTKKLTSIFTESFSNAAAKRDVPEITKYFQLFPLINQEEKGLNCYAKFIRSIISDTSRALVNSASSSGDTPKAGLFATISMQLFENVSVMISQHGPLINRYYGSTYTDAIKYVITKIQQEIDSQIGLIADSFYDLRRIEKGLQDTKLFKFSKRSHDPNDASQIQGQEVDETDFISIVEVGDLVDEFASIFHHWALYCKFITVNYFPDHQSQQPQQPSQQAFTMDHPSSIPQQHQNQQHNTHAEGFRLPELIVKSNFTHKLHDKYLPAFEALYKYYFRRSLAKAITIEELPSLDQYLLVSPQSKSPDQVPVSSVIEDFSLVLNSVSRNIVDSGQPTTVKKFINDCFPVVQNDLINGFLIKSLNDNQPRYNATLTLVNPSAKANGGLSGTVSPGLSRSNTPIPESGGTGSGVGGTGMNFFKGASSALGNVVGGGGSAVNSIATTVSNNSKLVNFVIYLNTVAMGQEYITKIFENITKGSPAALSSNYPFGKDGEKIFNIIKHEFVEPFNSITTKIISDSLINFYNQSLKNKILTMINDVFPDASESTYIIYSSNSLSDTEAILRFTNVWQSLIRPYKQTLHKTLIFDKLLRLLVVNLANLIERKLVSALKKFKINELGSLKLEKDLSFVINEVCEDNYELREKFLRVTQLVLLVGMDDDEYDLNIQNKVNNETTYNGDGEKDGSNENEEDEFMGINWVLTPQERRQFRKFRI